MSLLATVEQVKKAMCLSVDELRQALKNTGYDVPRYEILDAVFKGYNGTAFVYEITFQDPESGFGTTGKVFVQLKKPAFESEFNFYAEY